jgi:hypothetical protein
MGTHYYCANNCVSTLSDHVGSDSDIWHPQYNSYENKRPGGRSATAEIKSTNPSVTETYHLLGDDSSVRAVMDALISNCSIQDTKGSIANYDPDASNRPVKPEQVVSTYVNRHESPANDVLQVQWYRSSSFALALDKYNNTAAQFQNGPPNNDTAPPSVALSDLPSDINSGFLTCLNETTGFAVPLIEGDPQQKEFSGGELAGIIIGSIIGGILLLVILPWLIFRRYKRQKARRNGNNNVNFTQPAFMETDPVTTQPGSGGYSTYPQANPGSASVQSTTRMTTNAEGPSTYGGGPMRMPEPNRS